MIKRYKLAHWRVLMLVWEVIKRYKLAHWRVLMLVWEVDIEIPGGSSFRQKLFMCIDNKRERSWCFLFPPNVVALLLLTVAGVGGGR